MSGLLSIIAAEKMRMMAGVALCGLQAASYAFDCAASQPEELTFEGTASYYGRAFHGRITANGEQFDKNALTAAHRSLPFGTVLKVRNIENSKESLLRVNDRGPYVDGRIIDVSEAAARQLDFIDQGLADVEIFVLYLPLR